MDTYVAVDRMMLSYLLFGLVLIRCSGIAVFAPFFGSETFPAKARVLLAIFMALAMFPVAAPAAVIPPVLDAPELGLLALQELSIGVVLGFLSSLVFMGAQLAGQLVGQQVGFAMANVLDPMTNLEVSIIGYFKMNLAMLIFLVANLHLHVIMALKVSYDYAAIGAMAFGNIPGPLNEAASHHMEVMFVVALQLAMPVLVAMLLNSVIEGFITRTMPQMNIMVLGLPLRVTIGVSVLMLAMPTLIRAMELMLRDMVYDLQYKTAPLFGGS